MKKIGLIIQLLFSDIILCYVLMGNAPMLYFLYKIGVIEKAYKQSGAHGDTSMAVIFGFLFLLFLFLFVLNIILTTIVVYRSKHQQEDRNLIILIITICINCLYFYLLYLCGTEPLIPAPLVPSFIFECLLIDIIIVWLVLLVYKYMHKKIFGTKIHTNAS